MIIKQLTRCAYLSGPAHRNFLTIRSLSVSAAKYNDIDVSVNNGIKTITMNRAAKYNAITNDMYRSMAKHLLDSNQDNSVKIVVLTGAGDKYFTSGYDLKCLIEDCENKVPAQNNGATAFISALIETRKPLIGLVNGNAIGIGVTLLAHCEAVYAVDTAIFNTPFIRLGIPPECCSSYLFPKIVGHAKAGALLHFNGTWTAKEANENGLVTEIFSPEKFQQASWEKINKMAEFPLEALLHSKGLLRDRERDTLRKALDEENSKFDIEYIGKNVMAMLASKKKK